MNPLDKFSLFSPLDYRYVDGDLHRDAERFFSENARVRYQARVEAALVKALSKQGVCTPKIADEVSKAAEKITAEEVYTEEAKIRHDVRALANVLRSKVSKEAKPFIHFSATSYDIVDTASALRYKEATHRLVVPELKKLLHLWLDIAIREKKTLQIGRTHGQHAEPITFGFAMGSYINRLGEMISSLEWYADNLEGKFSGAVGSYNASSLLVKDPIKLEADILGELGLKQGLHSTQIVEPESLVDLVDSIIMAFSVLANFADDMRHLQRSEIGEIAEDFGSRQVGSSTMPHKRNPITFENVKSMWKEFMPRMVTMHMDSISEHQRDLTNSASARFIPEIFLGLLVACEKLQNVSSSIVVDREAMKRNFNASRESIVAEPLYILLAKHSHPDAHEVVRGLTLKSAKSGKGVLELAKTDKALASYLRKFSTPEMNLLKNPESYTGLAVKRTEEVCAHWKKRFP
ncbi:MAG TPA: lyase family protein [archaeon]|nr:lyase family protein [archaeon]